MKNAKSLKSALMTILSLSVLSSCGSNGITGENTQDIPQINDGGSPPIIDDGSGFAAIPWDFSLAGMTASGYSSNILTDNLLRVKVRARQATRNQGSTNFVSDYKCAIFRVMMEVADVASPSNGTTLTRPTTLNWRPVTLPVAPVALTVPGSTGCAGSVAEQVLDFSGQLHPGHSYVRMKVQALETDFTCNLPQYAYCRQQFELTGSFPNTTACNYACPTMPPTNVATVNGSLEIQVNGSIFN
jgi:hypothetical protein